MANTRPEVRALDEDDVFGSEQNPVNQSIETLLAKERIYNGNLDLISHALTGLRGVETLSQLPALIRDLKSISDRFIDNVEHGRKLTRDTAGRREIDAERSVLVTEFFAKYAQYMDIMRTYREVATKEPQRFEACDRLLSERCRGVDLRTLLEEPINHGKAYQPLVLAILDHDKNLAAGDERKLSEVQVRGLVALSQRMDALLGTAEKEQSLYAAAGQLLTKGADAVERLTGGWYRPGRFTGAVLGGVGAFFGGDKPAATAPTVDTDLGFKK